MKYIDADKLKGEIRKRINELDHLSVGDKTARIVELHFIDRCIDSLQQEQQTDKQVVVITESHGDANIEWDCRSIDDIKVLLAAGAHYISKKQEQSTPSCRSCGFYENNCPFIRDTFKPYPNKVCKDYTYSVMKEQTQPEVDIEKIIEQTYHDGSVADTYDIDHITYENIARHFYELGKNSK